MSNISPTLVASLIMLCNLGSGGAHADTPADLTDISFESLATMQVSTASRFAQSTREAPSAVVVILREDIRRHGWRTLTETLNSLPGFYSVNDGAYDFAGARGFLVPGDYNTRFLLLIDGQRLNDNIYQQALLGEEFPLDMSLVERIEYVPGPGSSIYGGNAIFGVINIITRKAAELPPLSASGLVTSKGREILTVTGSKQLKTGASIMASASHGHVMAHDLQFDDPTRNLVLANGQASLDGIAHDRGTEDTTRFFLRYEDGGFSLTGRYGQRIVQPATGIYTTLFDDPDTEITDSNWSVLGRYEAQLSGTFNLEARLELAQTTYEATLPYLDGNGARYLNHDESLGQWWAGDIRLLHTGWLNHKVIGGIDTQIDSKARQQNFDINIASNPTVDISSPEQRTGIYLQDEWLFADRWRLNAGLRHDHYSAADAVTSPRVGLIWLMSRAQTLKLLAGTAYRPANTYERDYSNGINYIGNKALEPETIRTLEAVFEQELSSTQQLSISAYRYRLNNLIVQQQLANNGLQYQNQPHIQAHGIEVLWQVQNNSGSSLSASLASGRAENDQGDRLSYSPNLIAKLRASLPIYQGRWQVAAESTFLSKTPYTWQMNTYHSKARQLLNASLTSAKVAPGLDAHIRILNLLNQHYDQPTSEEMPIAAIPGERRSIEAGLRYAF